MMENQHRDQWLTFYCYCGHHATVKLSNEPWQHRDKLLPRARCTVCGRRGAKNLAVANDPATLWDGRRSGP